MKQLPPPLDARQIPDLVGRYVECWHDGRRLARVRKVPGKAVLTVSFQATPGRRRLALDRVVGVLWRNKVVPLEAWCQMRKAKNEPPPATT